MNKELLPSQYLNTNKIFISTFFQHVNAVSIIYHGKTLTWILQLRLTSIRHSFGCSSLFFINAFQVLQKLTCLCTILSATFSKNLLSEQKDTV